MVVWLERQRSEVTSRIARLREKAVEMEKNLAGIRKSHNQALDRGDRKAAETFALTIATLREAHDNNASAQALENGRLEALTRAGNWRSMPRLQATTTDIVPTGGPSNTPPRNSFGVAGVVRGDVQIKTAQGWVKYDPTRPILPGDEVKTGPHSYAEVLFSDGSRMSMDENSSFHLNELGEEVSIYDAMKGAFHGKVECLKKRLKNLRLGLADTLPCQQHFRGSGSAPGAVRGTEFVMEVEANGRLTVTVFEGSFEVQIAKSERPLVILAGERAVVTPDRIVESHGLFESDKIRRWWRITP